MAVLDAGAEEVRDLGDTFEVVSEPTDLVAVRTALQDAGIDYDSAEAGFVPSVQVELDEDSAGKVFRLIDALEDSTTCRTSTRTTTCPTRSWRRSTPERRPTSLISPRRLWRPTYAPRQSRAPCYASRAA